MTGEWIIIGIIFGPLFIGFITGLLEPNSHPSNPPLIWNEEPAKPVFDSEEKGDASEQDDYSVLDEVQSSFQQETNYQASEPSPEMNGAIDELLSAVEMPVKNDSHSPELILESESQASEPTADMNGAIDELLVAVSMNQSDDSNEFIEEEWTKEDFVEEDKTLQMNDTPEEVSLSTEDEVNELTNHIEQLNKVEMIAESTMDEISPVEEPIIAEQPMNIGSDNENWIEDVKEEADIFTDVPDYFKEEEPVSEEGEGFNDDDLASFIGSTPIVNEKKVSNTQYKIVELTSTSSTKPSSKVDDLDIEETNNIVSFSIDQMPTPLEPQEFTAIKNRYGGCVAESITTTPVNGRANANDIMIGRLEDSAVGPVLFYGNYFVPLKGDVPENHFGYPILITGQFISPEKFYVNDWRDPKAYSENAMVPFSHYDREQNLKKVASFQ